MTTRLTVPRTGGLIVVLALYSAGGCGVYGYPDAPPGLSGVSVTETGWVAVGGPDRALALLSADGWTWQRSDIPDSAARLSDVAFGNGTIVAVGSELAAKRPGADWQVQPFDTNGHVVFGNGIFLAETHLGRVTVSSDGVSWTTTAEEPGLWFTFDGERFVSYREPDFRTSVDGLNWSDPVTPSTHLWGIGCLAAVGEQILGFGVNCHPPTGCTVVQLLGSRGTDASSFAITSSPPWTDGTVPLAIAHDGVHVVVVSADLIGTTTLPVGSAAWALTDARERGWSLTDVNYSSGTFVAVGTTYGGQPLIVTSPDGGEWTEASVP